MNAFTIMIDTIGACVGNIPRNALKVAGYVTGTGDVPWTLADFQEFEKTAGVVRIIQRPGSDVFGGDVFDIEPGALNIAEFVVAAKTREQHKWSSCGYIDATQAGSLVQACSDAGLTMVTLWIANWNLNETQAISLLGTKMREYPVVAVQYASPASNPNTVCPGSSKTLKELNLDLSVTLPTWFPAPSHTPVAPPPPAVPPTSPQTSTLALTTAHGTLDLPIKSADGKTWELA